jgi:hypothetical protein
MYDTPRDYGISENNLGPRRNDDPDGRNMEERVRNQVLQEVNIQQRRRDFWQAFYSSYPHLKVHEDEVNVCMANNLDEIGNLPLEQGLHKLAELTDEYVRHKKWNEKRQEEHKGITDIEGHPSQAPYSNPDDTLGGYIKKRKEARAKQYDVLRGAE